MIHLISNYCSENIESLKKYFQIERFRDFQEYENYLNQFTDLNFNLPLAIISEEKIKQSTIYNLISRKSYFAKIQQIPVMVLKDKLDGFEFDYMQNKIIDDFIAKDTRVEDLAERIRFIVMQHQEIGKTQSNVEEQRIRIVDMQMILRRILEFSVSVLLLTFLSPLLLIIAILIKLESRGPIFYVSYRAGNGYNIFRIFKFRTMLDHADMMLDNYRDLNQYNQNSTEGESAFFKLNNDPRVTRLGTFLRKTSIDELPQLFNVITGDMSLIGNRPLPLYEASKLTKDHYAMRFNAPAGITGLWQVNKRGKHNMSDEERINLDIEYANHCNLISDIKIFFRTFPALIQDTTV